MQIFFHIFLFFFLKSLIINAKKFRKNLPKQTICAQNLPLVGSPRLALAAALNRCTTYARTQDARGRKNNQQTQEPGGLHMTNFATLFAPKRDARQDAPDRIRRR